MSQLLEAPAIRRLIPLYGRAWVREGVERVLGDVRESMAAEAAADVDLGAALDAMPSRVAERLATELGAPLQRTLNATGILVHTNLGRAPLPREVAAQLPGLLDAYCDLEMDLESGRRGQRNSAVEGLLKALTGAPAALVVNNNAAALVLALATLARGREVVVSRGELVEIGGSFRIPSILEAAGVILREVGTTNRTHLEDYEEALGPETALLLRVFPSNYKISGFTEAVGVEALVELGRRRGVVLLVDEGSGLLRPHSAPQLREHESLSELVELGCDLACGSGDKLLGGPQAGILVGSQASIEACRSSPLYRAMRPDRTCLAALSLVLRRHLAEEPLPLDGMWPDVVVHAARVAAVADAVGADVREVDGFIGGGSAPEAGIPAAAATLPADDGLLSRLRLGEPPVVAYQRDGRLVLDLRTLDPSDDGLLIEAVLRAQESH